ncbi:hypothetical protein [Bacillus paranthracis]|uniref:hypothetical protein n=1 Tax=Bacillus paranthracis TaxID=2026186 RepID=UPI002FDBE404|nr:hypothetical protein [Bacillus paranthracis]
MNDFTYFICFLTAIIGIGGVIKRFNKGIAIFIWTLAGFYTILGPICIEIMKPAMGDSMLHAQIEKKLGKDVTVEKQTDNTSMIVKSKTNTYIVKYNDEKEIKEIKNITEDEQKKRENIKEILKNL